MSAGRTCVHVFLTAVLTVLLGCGVALAATDDPARRSIEEQLHSRAAALLKEGRADEAYNMYRDLALENPDDDVAVLGLARAGAAGKQWNQAVMAYEMLLERYPGTATLHSELSHVYMMMGERAAAETEQAKAQGAGVTGESLPDLDKLETRYSRFQAHGKLRAGLLYDSNVNLGPETSNLHLGNWRVYAPDAANKSSFGAYLGLDLDLGWQLSRDSGWWLVGDVKGFWRGFEDASLHDDLRIRESQWARGAVGIRHIGSKTLFDVRFKADIFDYEFLQHVHSMGPELTFVYAFTPRIQSISVAGWDSRIYSAGPERNGGYPWVGEYLRFLIGEKNHELMLGGRINWGRSNFDDYSYEGWEASARVVFKLPHRFEFAPFASVAQEFYHGPATVLEVEERLDTRWRFGATLTWHVNESWALETSYQFTDNISNSEIYDYSQHLVTAGVSWSF